MIYAEIIAPAAARYGLDPKLVTAQIIHESGGDPFAVGDGGKALSVLQVHLEACTDLGRAADWSRLEACIAGKDPAALVLGLDLGCAYLARMMHRFGGSAADALMAYNQGPTVIGQAVAYRNAVLGLIAS